MNFLRNIRFLIGVIALITFSNCKSNDTVVDESNLKIIDMQGVNVYKHNSIESDSFFDSRTIIPLQTVDSSLFAGINRISISKNRIYILDNKTNAVYVFSKDDGSFRMKICRIGEGLGEYKQLTDFSIDEKNDKIFLYSDRPYKVLIFDLNGAFEKEILLDNLYLSFAYNNHVGVFYTYLDEFSLLLHNSVTNEDKYYLKNKGFSDKIILPSTKQLIRSENLFFMNPYSADIYKVKTDSVQHSFRIDMGENFIDEDKIRNLHSAFDVNEYCLKNKKAYAISSFRENNSYITFGIEPSGSICIYSKKNNKIVQFDEVVDLELSVKFGNYLGHDGHDEDFVLYTRASEFKNNIGTIKDPEIKRTKQYQKVKRLADSINEYSNHVLIIYHFKK